MDMMKMFSGIMSMIKGGSNPEALMSLMCQGNPQMGDAIKHAQNAIEGQNNVEQYVREMYKKQGMNIEDTMKQLGL